MKQQQKTVLQAIIAVCSQWGNNNSKGGERNVRRNN